MHLWKSIFLHNLQINNWTWYLVRYRWEMMIFWKYCLIMGGKKVQWVGNLIKHGWPVFHEWSLECIVRSKPCALLGMPLSINQYCLKVTFYLFININKIFLLGMCVRPHPAMLIPGSLLNDNSWQCSEDLMWCHILDWDLSQSTDLIGAFHMQGQCSTLCTVTPTLFIIFPSFL